MSPRLQELVRQSGIDDPDFPIEDWDNIPLTKFAQLIILECDQYARCTWENGEILGGDLKKHFGFEA